MVKEHLTSILGGNGGVVGGPHEDKIVVGTSKLRLGQVYAASIMYGYFLTRVDQRFQLEKSVQLLQADWTEGLGEPLAGGKARLEDVRAEGSTDNEPVISLDDWAKGSDNEGEGEGKESPTKSLQAYIRSLDADTLQSTATMRSK